MYKKDGTPHKEGNKSESFFRNNKKDIIEYFTNKTIENIFPKTGGNADVRDIIVVYNDKTIGNHSLKSLKGKKDNCTLGTYGKKLVNNNYPYFNILKPNIDNILLSVKNENNIYTIKKLKKQLISLFYPYLDDLFNYYISNDFLNFLSKPDKESTSLIVWYKNYDKYYYVPNYYDKLFYIIKDNLGSVRFNSNNKNVKSKCIFISNLSLGLRIKISIPNWDNKRGFRLPAIDIQPEPKHILLLKKFGFNFYEK